MRNTGINKAPKKADLILDDFFSGKPGALSFRECYAAITGDLRVTGQWRNCDQFLLREAFGEAYLEAMTTASWAVALGSAIQRRMQSEFSNLEDLQAWRRIAVVASTGSFRDQISYRIGGYGNLSTVDEGDPYPALSSPDDTSATYRVAKRGGVDSITLEMVANDDTGAIRRIPAEFAMSAAMTLYEFVFDFIRTNPVIHDGAALFSAPHGNLGAAALAVESYYTASMTIAKQVRPGSGKRIGFGRKALLVPLELQQMADDLFIKGRSLEIRQNITPDVMVVPYWTDATDWAVVNDPAYVPTIEVGFLGGREQPEVLVQDEQTADGIFSHDKLTYKIKHVYGGAVLSHQGMYKSVVAG